MGCDDVFLIFKNYHQSCWLCYFSFCHLDLANMNLLKVNENTARRSLLNNTQHVFFGKVKLRHESNKDAT